ncbi:MAG: helix-turn-helix domain-containing protein, partial [Ktedonobacterales bacterium]
MSRTQRANKRAASRRHHVPASPRRSSLRVIAQPASPASAIPTHTCTDAPMNGTPAPIPPSTTPAPGSPIGQDRQDHEDHRDHRAHRAHPDQAALKERAFALSCIGLRSPAIAAQLGVSERTIRHWNYTTLRTLALDATGLSSDLDTPTDPHASGSTAPTSPDAPTSTGGAASEPAVPAPDTYRIVHTYPQYFP